LDKSGLKTQPDRTHTHGLGRNFCPKPNPTATLDIDDNYENSQSVDSLLQSRDIYNFKIKARRDALESLTLI
jgi:hypothetical protein